MIVSHFLPLAIFALLTSASPAPNKVVYERTPTVALVGLQKRQDVTITNWTPYVSTVSADWGALATQNVGIINQPVARAVCAGYIASIEDCMYPVPMDCDVERAYLQWCLLQRLGPCSSTYVDASYTCIGDTAANCITALTNLHSCANSVTVTGTPPGY